MNISLHSLKFASHYYLMLLEIYFLWFKNRWNLDRLNSYLMQTTKSRGIDSSSNKPPKLNEPTAVPQLRWALFLEGTLKLPSVICDIGGEVISHGYRSQKQKIEISAIPLLFLQFTCEVVLFVYMHTNVHVHLSTREQTQSVLFSPTSGAIPEMGRSPSRGLYSNWNFGGLLSDFLI